MRMATTDLKFDNPGSLPKPGPVGRLVRLVFGLICTWYVVQLLEISGQLMADGGRIKPVVWNGILIGLFLVSYVVNIGYSRAWKKWPALISGGIFLAIAAYGHSVNGSYETYLLARTVWGWEIYLFSHLGLAFIISALLATPGCEMRAFHDLYSRLSGVPVKEHVCPVGPLNAIDQWEAGRKQR